MACKPGDDAGVVELLVRVLGPLEVWRAGALVPIGGPKARLTLAVLLAHRSSVVSVDRLADALWGDDPPPTAVATIQSNVSRLRRALAPDVDIVARAPGYVLEAPTESVDAAQFEDLTQDASAVRSSSKTLRPVSRTSYPTRNTPSRRHCAP